MTVLISPLSWGFGHAGRMIPLAVELQRRGARIIFAADGSLLQMVQRDVPGITPVEIPGLRMRYSRSLPQYICIFLQMPHIIASAVRDHRTLRRLVSEYNPSVIISDNRFGFYNRRVFSAYVTHQLRIPFPGPLRFMEPLAMWIHRVIINRFDLCLVPDYPGSVNLSGRLSHGLRLPRKVIFSGPLSRFSTPDGREPDGRDPGVRNPDRTVHDGTEPDGTVPGGTELNITEPDGTVPGGTELNITEPDRTELNITEPDRTELNITEPDRTEPERTVSGVTGSDVTQPGTPDQSHPVCLLLSGPEPQRTLLLKKIIETLSGFRMVVLTATPLPLFINETPPGIRVIIAPDTRTMRQILVSSSLVIARSGYSSVMELVSLGKGAVIIPTPGQPEQEYLGRHLNGMLGFVTVSQHNLDKLPAVAHERTHNQFSLRPGGDNALLTGKQEGTDTAKPSASRLPDADPLLEKAINSLLKHNKK